MNYYVYYTVIIFSLIIFFLYVYIFIEKIIQLIIDKKKNIYLSELIPYLDNLIIIMDERYLNNKDIIDLKKLVKNSIKRELIKYRIIYYFENFKGDIIKNLSRLCKDIDLLDYEIKSLKSKDTYKAALACKNIGEFRNKIALNKLLPLVDSSSYDIKYNALLAISKIGDEEVFISAFNKLKQNIPLSQRSLIEIIDSFEGNKTYIYKKMIHSQNDYLSYIFIKSAGNYMDTSLSDDIAKYILDDNKEKRIASIKTIGAMADIRYIDDIIQSLDDSEWEVRAVSAKVLGRFEDNRALYPLMKALSDKQWHVRFNAANSILNIPKGLDNIKEILNGEDNFAKDIIISTIENCEYFKNKLYLYENSFDENEKIIAYSIKNYLNSNLR